MMRLIPLLLLSFSPHGVEAFSSPSNVVFYEVCTSPTCADDGALATMAKLQALAPPGLSVRSGSCVNNLHCGQGPVVTANNQKFHRHVKDAGKILDLLLAISEETQIPSKLIQGYDIAVKAEEAYHLGHYQDANALYQQAVDLGMQPALELQQQRDALDALDDANAIPTGLLWLIRAHRHWALALLQLDDVSGALQAAQAACELANHQCHESLEVLASVHQRQGNKLEELEAISQIFDLTVDTTPQNLQEENRRREHTFRKATLEREISGQPLEGIFQPDDWINWRDRK